MTQRLSLRLALLLYVALIGIGTVGYMLTEGWSPGMALYTAVTTLVTLGIERPTTPAGMAFTVAFVLVGVATSFYILGTLVSFVAEGGFRHRMRRQRMEREIARLHDHFIVCGYGRVGRQIVAEFAREDVSFVVIDSVQESLAAVEAEGHCAITGSPASDEAHVSQLESVTERRGATALNPGRGCATIGVSEPRACGTSMRGVVTATWMWTPRKRGWR